MNIDICKNLSLIIFSCTLALASCNNKSNQPRFELLTSDHTGITFQNTLEETPQMNIFTYLYFYNGGGVATGDLNGNGFPDLYFTSNLESNKLYVNNGDFKFTDVTETANVAGKKGWTTGVTMADVNGDGKLDIYVSRLGDYKNIRGRNQLYINVGNDENGIPLFEDQAKQWGLDLVGFSTQAAFFDYDLDGDLDIFMLNHSVHANGTYGKSTLRFENHPLAGDKLFRNDGDKFTEVTEEAGIYNSVIGYGLGVTISDVNWDGYPDIYVGNDFHENDYLYINNGDGTFTEKLEASMGHTSRYSMGNDIADINNDGFPDIISLDMLPAEYEKLKASAGEDPYDVYDFKLNYGYNHQFARNTLQLNLGNGKFSEIALLSGIHATDWSWSSLFADFDLDGNKDIFISNGIKRRMNDLDYINFISNEAIQNRLGGDLSDEDLALIEKMPVVKIPNYAFQNTGGLQFKDVSKEWGLNEDSFSNGSVYVDLDNDGDLDLVINNIDQEAFIYRNNTISPEKTDNNYLRLQFKGKAPNHFGTGTKVIIPLGEKKIVQELFPTRGYLSSVNNDIVVGLGKQELIDSLIIIWTDHSFQVLKKIPVNQTLEIDQNNAAGQYDFTKTYKPVFKDVSDSLNIDYKHEENKFIEFNREPLIPHMNSTEGPRIAVGDVNGDEKEDFFIGGAKHQEGTLFIQTDDGFAKSEQEAFAKDKLNEDIGTIFIDVDNDGDLDLIVISGGNEFQNKEKPLQPRLYLNDGSGNFSSDENAFPDVFLTGSCIKPVDFNNDGFVDLFLGGRILPWNYGENPASYLLVNDGKGRFINQTKVLAPELESLGMVKDAAWQDMDGDGKIDLVVVGEWMPITILSNKDGSLKKEKIADFNFSNGWWNTAELADINNDGNMDIIAGNLGLNSILKSSKDEPVSLYVKDLNKNGKKDQLLYYYHNGEEHLFANKDELGKQNPEIKNKFNNYTDFAKAKNSEIFSTDELKGATKLVSYEFRSGIFINKGELKFEFMPFPTQAQFAPINAIQLLDYDKDGNWDILTGGNFYEVNIQRGRYDADYGTLLRNTGNGELKALPNLKSGLQLKGQVRDIKEIVYGGEKLFIVAKNNETIQFLMVLQNPVNLQTLRGKLLE